MGFETERRIWDAECDEVAAKLVRQGTPPNQAIRQAQTIVSGRRAGRKITKKHFGAADSGQNDG